MKNLILKLKTLLPAENFIVTGSYVLSLFGLYGASNDLDIILVNPTDATKDALNRLMKDFPAKTTIKIPKDKTDEDEVEVKKPTKKVMADCYAIFMYDQVKVDVFIETKSTRPFITIDDINYSTIKDIVDAKKGYNRMKDWLQLRDIARIFFKQDEFNAMLNSNWKQTLKQEY